MSEQKVPPIESWFLEMFWDDSNPKKAHRLWSGLFSDNVSALHQSSNNSQLAKTGAGNLGSVQADADDIAAQQYAEAVLSLP